MIGRLRLEPVLKRFSNQDRSCEEDLYTEGAIWDTPSDTVSFRY